MKTAIICVAGRIQEVGYRTRVIGIAKILKIKGYVQNLPDMRVEIIAQASEEVIQEFIKKIDIQDELVHVDTLKVEYSEHFEGFKDFHKIVGENETDSRLDKAVIELKNIVTAIKNMNQNMQEGNQEIITTIKEGNQELKDEIRTSNQEIIREIRDGNQGIKDEIHALRMDAHERDEAFKKEVRDDIKAIKVHLKIP